MGEIVPLLPPLVTPLEVCTLSKYNEIMNTKQYNTDKYSNIVFNFCLRKYQFSVFLLALAYI